MELNKLAMVWYVLRSRHATLAAVMPTMAADKAEKQDAAN
jgi:hypothetical protein